MAWNRKPYKRSTGGYQPHNARLAQGGPPKGESLSVRVPSKYQAAILSAFRDGRDNLLIQARAGSGKTSTLEMLAREVSGQGVFLAFNRSIAEELKKRLPSGVESSTFHSLAFGMLRPTIARLTGKPVKFGNGPDAWIQARKCATLFESMYGRDSGMDLGHLSSAVCRVVSLCKANLYDENTAQSDVERLIAWQGIEWEDDTVDSDRIAQMALDVLRASNAQLEHGDFDDMLYLLWKLDVRASSGKYSVVMVDEAQDTNTAQREILRRLGCSAVGGVRLVAVGDEAQAIYGFRGADSDSMKLVREEFGCVELPLSISYRCPASVVREAQMYVADIESADGAKEGKVRSVDRWTLEQFDVDGTDLVVCRNNKPLIALAYKMLAARVPCRVMGRDIGQGLISLVKRLCGRGWEDMAVEQIAAKVSAWRIKELDKTKNDGLKQSIDDKAECVLCVLESEGVARGRDFERIVSDMFGLNSKESEVRGVRLGSVHKSKGTESKRVFVLDRGLMPSKYARLDWQKVQERNLAYVAVTRSLEELVYVDSECIE